MSDYMDFPVYDNTFISVHPYISNESVAPHKHNFQEFVLIVKGSCTYRCRRRESILIPGDVFLFPPHQEHSYAMQGNVEILNVCFYPERLGEQWSNFMVDIAAPRDREGNAREQFRDLLQNVALRDDRDTPTFDADLNTQGIIHLKPSEASRVENLLRAMMAEQNNQELGVEYMKPAMLQMVLVLLERARTRQSSRSAGYSSQKRQMILDALNYIETHITETIDFEDLAFRLHLSSSYFRVLFKDVTGLPPVEYLNRLRIVKSLQYLQADDLSIANAAARVGIYDPNYYSRLFKKVMGVPPRYFKNISAL